MQCQFLIYPVAACLVNAIAAFWFHDPTRGMELRRMLNTWMLNTSWFWQPLITLPYKYVHCTHG